MNKKELVALLEQFGDDDGVFVWDADTSTFKEIVSASDNGGNIQLNTEQWI